jgi:hypothetical protein
VAAVPGDVSPTPPQKKKNQKKNKRKKIKKEEKSYIKANPCYSSVIYCFREGYSELSNKT